MTDPVLGPDHGRTQSGEPGTLSYIENQLRMMAPYDFELVVAGPDLVIRVGNRAHERDMVDLMSQHRNTLLPAVVAYRVEIDRNIELARQSRGRGNLVEDRQIINEINDHLEVSFLAGTHIHDALDFLVKLSNQRKMPAFTVFNGQRLMVGKPPTHEAAKPSKPKQRRRINLGDD